MQNERNNWRAQQGARALKAMAGIRASIEALAAEDLLDLHDIFRDGKGSLLCEIADAEIAKRGLSYHA